METKQLMAILGIIAGLGLVIFGAGIDLSVVGLPEGITADVVGVIIILVSLGFL